MYNYFTYLWQGEVNISNISMFFSALSITVLRALSERSAEHIGQILLGAGEHGTGHDFHVLGDDVLAQIVSVEREATPMSFHERTDGQHNTRLQLQRVQNDMQKKNGAGPVRMYSSLLSLSR